MAEAGAEAEVPQAENNLHDEEKEVSAWKIHTYSG